MDDKLISIAKEALRLIRPEIAPDPIEWITNVDLSNDPSSEWSGKVKLDYYQIDPIKAQFNKDVRQVTIMAPEQTGKSFCHRLSILYKIRWMPGTFWIVYESDDKAEDINRETLHPLLKAVPEINAMLNRNTMQNRRYQLPNGSIVDFSGAGAAITSKAKRDGVADEIDTWPMPAEGKRRNLANFKKRFRVAWRQGKGCLVKCSSPKGEDSIIGDEWEAGTQGRWNLQCQGCKKVCIPSHRHDMVQWERRDNGDVIESSIRIICPLCNYEHIEAEAVAMNKNGKYIHKYPERIDHQSFQWGALACPRVFSWMDFATAAVAGGKTGDLESQIYFDNSFRGIPFVKRKALRVELDVLKKHEGDPPKPETLCGLLLGADTQSKGWYWVVLAVDIKKRLWMPKNGYGLASSAQELIRAWDTKYFGHLPVLGIIDEGGHRKDDVDAIVENRAGLFKYKGNPRIGVDWKINKEEDKKRILANPHTYRFRMLHRLYMSEKDDNMWIGFPKDEVSKEFYDMLSFRPNSKVKNGHRLENWQPADDENDHWFDCLKMIEVLLDFGREKMPVSEWLKPASWMKAPVKMRRRR